VKPPIRIREDRTIESIQNAVAAVKSVYESIAKAVGALESVILVVFMVFVTLALLITGNTLARVIGGVFLLVFLVLAARRIRARQALKREEGL
jgi:hypothetical protein